MRPHITQRRVLLAVPYSVRPTAIPAEPVTRRPTPKAKSICPVALRLSIDGSTCSSSGNAVGVGTGVPVAVGEGVIVGVCVEVGVVVGVLVGVAVGVSVFMLTIAFSPMTISICWDAIASPAEAVIRKFPVRASSK